MFTCVKQSILFRFSFHFISSLNLLFPWPNRKALSSVESRIPVPATAGTVGPGNGGKAFETSFTRDMGEGNQWQWQPQGGAPSSPSHTPIHCHHFLCFHFEANCSSIYSSISHISHSLYVLSYESIHVDVGVPSWEPQVTLHGHASEPSEPSLVQHFLAAPHDGDQQARGWDGSHIVSPTPNCFFEGIQYYWSWGPGQWTEQNLLVFSRIYLIMCVCLFVSVSMYVSICMVCDCDCAMMSQKGCMEKILERYRKRRLKPGTHTRQLPAMPSQVLLTRYQTALSKAAG